MREYPLFMLPKSTKEEWKSWTYWFQVFELNSGSYNLGFIKQDFAKALADLKI